MIMVCLNLLIVGITEIENLKTFAGKIVKHKWTKCEM